jgi:hypothetical protein
VKNPITETLLEMRFFKAIIPDLGRIYGSNAVQTLVAEHEPSE